MFSEIFDAMSSQLASLQTDCLKAGSGMLKSGTLEKLLMKELGHVELIEGRSPLTKTPQGPTNLQIQQVLSSILGSSVFRTSKQSQRLLEYLVDQTLQGHEEMLKERIVGAQVFERNADYNTGDDPIVRVRAGDLRKRLAQYYTAEGREDDIRIEILPGSYHPTFSFSSRNDSIDRVAEAADTIPEPTATEAASSRTLKTALSPTMQRLVPLFRKHRVVVGAALCLVVLISTGLVYRMQKTAADMFWEPVLKSPEPALIYFGTSAVYSLSFEVLDNYRASHPLEQQGQEFFVDFPPGTKIDAKDLVPANDRVMVNDFAAAAEVVTFLNHHGKPFDLRWGHDISPGDLKHSPVILIGAFNNYLTLDLTNQLRFEFTGGNQIKDRANPQLSWSVVWDAKGNCLDDYAIVSRLVRPKSGATVITAAGIGQEGTQAAGEFLNNPQQIANAVKGLPRNWDQKNMQILLHIKGGYGAPNSVSVESVYVW